MISCQPARPSRADCSALTEATVEAVRMLFLDGVLSRPLSIKLHLFGIPNAFATFLGLEGMGV